jgi:hypothetical protein
MAWNIRSSRTFSPDLEVLAHAENAEIAASIVLDASTFPLNADGERELLAGTPLVKNVNNQYQAYNGTTSDTEVQSITVDATGGTFTLTHGAQTTASITYGATAATIKTRLEALSTISDVDVTGSGDADDPYIVTFNVPAEAGAITATDSLTGGAGTVTISGTVSGILGILCTTERVPDTEAHSDVASAMWCHLQWFRADRIVGWASYSTAIKAALPTCKFS